MRARPFVGLVLWLAALAGGGACQDAPPPTEDEEALNSGDIVLNVGRSMQYATVTSAVAAARGMAGGRTHVTINVRPGVYKECFRIDFSHVTLHGSNVPIRDGQGWQTSVRNGTSTVIQFPESIDEQARQGCTTSVGDPACYGTVCIEPPSGESMLTDITISNLSFTGGPGAVAVGGIDGLDIDLVQGFQILDNDFEGSGNPDFDLEYPISPEESSGVIIGNRIAGTFCAVCYGAGRPAAPSSFAMVNNSSVHNCHGLLVQGGSDSYSDGNQSLATEMSADVIHNDLSENNALPVNEGDPLPDFCSGSRLFMTGRDLPDPAAQTGFELTARFIGNRMHDNNFGLSMDAAFPFRTFFDGTPDPALFSGSLHLTLISNDIQGSVSAPALITFNRSTSSEHTVEQCPSSTQASFKFLQSSTYNIITNDHEIDGYWVDNPVTDPVDGRNLMNRLYVNQRLIRPGRSMGPWPAFSGCP